MTLTTLTYRKAVPSDAAAILALISSAYRAGILTKINEPHGAILLAYDENDALASCCELLKQDDTAGYFGLFSVDPKRQASGIGRQVLAQAEMYARDAWGVNMLEMTVIWTREELIAWYIRRGYTKTQKTKPFPYNELAKGAALRDDLYFVVLKKSI